ncbi:MAG: hypothetical protein WC523_00520 [Patescibacteria group bacterium]
MTFSILRIVNLTTSSASILFNDYIDTSIGIDNVSISSTIYSVDDPDIISLSIDSDIINITFSPLFPNIQYNLKFFSTETVLFKSSENEIIIEDGHKNSVFIVSPGETTNNIRDSIIESIPSIYDSGESTIIRKLISSSADQFQKVSDSIDITKSGNYLSILVEDESIIRGDGPTDKLLNQGAFEISRVSSSPSGNNISGFIEFNQSRKASFLVRPNVHINPIIESLTLDPISLQAEDVINELVTDDIDIANHFSGLTIKVSNHNVIQLISVGLIRNNATTEYDISQFGYILRDNRYDTSLAGINVNLNDDEIELSSNSITGLSGGFLFPQAGDQLKVSYVYKKLGKTIDIDNVLLSTIELVTREVAPAIVNRFSVDNAPIINNLDQLLESGGITFLSTITTDDLQAFVSTHPAFTKEIDFSISRSPSRPGDYSINYSTGEVNVFGEDKDNNGTGDYPPAMTYLFRKIFTKNLDYSIDEDKNEIAINSSRDLSGLEAKITFYYEETFAENTDYRVLSHQEALNERIENRLISDFKLITKKYPITDVFKVMNETTGEIYSISRFDDSSISFSGRNAPTQLDSLREKVSFSSVDNETLYVSDELTNSLSLRIFKINLQNSGISDFYERFVGSNFNTSVSFSNTLFSREFFFEDILYTDLSANLDKLQAVGDFLIDYYNGIVYVAVSSAQSVDVGEINYKYKYVKTKNSHILDIYNIYRSPNPLVSITKSYTIGDAFDNTFDTEGIEYVGQRFLNNDNNRPMIVGTSQSGIDGVSVQGDNIFSSNSSIFTDSDVGKTLVVGSSNDPPAQIFIIISVIDSQQVIVDQNFLSDAKNIVWSLVDTSLSAPKTIVVDFDIISVRGIYKSSQLETLPFESLNNYFDITSDSFTENIITLGDDNDLQNGDSVVIDYNYGELFVDYKYLKDEILVSYEYGNNSIDWSISNSLVSGQNYYVTYRYGALRNQLLSNFGSLTQIKELTTFSPNIEREMYRSILGGTLQSFITGPTIPSIENLVESFTEVKPNITENVNGWVLGNSNLYLENLKYNNTESYDFGKFDEGLLITGSQKVDVPALSHIRLDEGTFETWIVPSWDGDENDSSITFDLSMDGYSNIEDVHIGFSGENPETIPFTLELGNNKLSMSQPEDNDDVGYFIWYDNDNNQWVITWKQTRDADHTFSGTINTTGEFYNISYPSGQDGYSVNEINDTITSFTNRIDFSANIDGYDVDINDDNIAEDGVSFSSGDFHYIVDMAKSPDTNRFSLFKDGTGFLNFRIFDAESNKYNLSTNIKDWEFGQLHHIAVSWKLNTPFEKDEMHLFIDGQEVSNLYKYGGRPEPSNSYFGDISSETVTSSSAVAIVGGFDGSSASSSNMFISNEGDFISNGIQVGDKLYILDDTPDGIGSPNLGTYYNITGVGDTSLTLDRNLTLSLGNIHYGINISTNTIETPANNQRFIVITIDSQGTETELNGVNSRYPDYYISRGSNYTNVLSITNGVNVGDSVVVKTLGLLFSRVLEKKYIYDGGFDTIKTNSMPPVNLGEVKVTEILFDNSLVSQNNGFSLNSVLVDLSLEDVLQRNFDAYCQPSNGTNGRKLAITLIGDNINYNVDYNFITIYGTTYSGNTSEIITFDSNAIKYSSEYWRYIDYISVNIVPLDSLLAAGTFTIREKLPITESENNGDYAEIAEYSNGFFRFEIFGSAGIPFILNGCFYEIDYPTFLRINLNEQPTYMQIGSDFNGSNVVDAVLDEVRILDYMSTDTRVGEELGTLDRTITTDYNYDFEFTADDNTLLLLHWDKENTDSSEFIDRFDSGFEIAKSVNDNFKYGIKLKENHPFIINNAGSIFDNDEGTIEFWVSPLDDSNNNSKYHYYLDMLSSVDETVSSITKISVLLNQKASSVKSVRLASDIYNAGTNYFDGGGISTIDNKTITLGIPLPSQNTLVKVTYIPINNSGDRVSLFLDPYGFVNFFVKASSIEHLLSVHVDWQRNTWHRIMIMWKTNSSNGLDRLRLFVDGDERGTIKYGTGLIYGTGIVYGQAEIRPGTNRFLVDNIDMSDVFSSIFIGADIFSVNGANAIMDNIRFSDIQRLQSIKNVSGVFVDVNYQQNTDFALPVIQDLNTTALYDFDALLFKIQDFSEVTNASNGIFKFSVDVIDSFDKVIGNDYLTNLLKSLINVIKPANTTAIIKFSK